MSARRILVVDDEQHILDVVVYVLEQHSFEVSTATDGEDVLNSLGRVNPNLVILDLGLPGMSGLDLFHELRARCTALAIIMLTSRSDEVDRVVGLELGADDYVTKPFSPRELVARVRAVLRRSSGAPSTSDSLRSGGMPLDTAAHTATRDGAAIDLTPSEFAMPHVLMEMSLTPI